MVSESFLKSEQLLSHLNSQHFIELRTFFTVFKTAQLNQTNSFGTSHFVSKIQFNVFMVWVTIDGGLD
jgi:hypothetical protein